MEPSSSGISSKALTSTGSTPIRGIDNRMDGKNLKINSALSPISDTTSPPGWPQSPGTSRRVNGSLPVPSTNNNLKKFWKLPSASKDSPTAEASSVRWDEYSGEPTESDRGKPPSATPGSVKLHEAPIPSKTNSTAAISTGSDSRSAIGKRRIASAETPEVNSTMSSSVSDPVQQQPQSDTQHGQGQILHQRANSPEVITSPNLHDVSSKRTDTLAEGTTRREQETKEHEEGIRDAERRQRLHKDRIARAKRDRERAAESHGQREIARSRSPLERGIKDIDIARPESMPQTGTAATTGTIDSRDHLTAPAISQPSTERPRSPPSVPTGIVNVGAAVQIKRTSSPTVNPALAAYYRSLRPTEPDPALVETHPAFRKQPATKTSSDAMKEDDRDRRSPLARNPSREKLGSFQASDASKASPGGDMARQDSSAVKRLEHGGLIAPTQLASNTDQVEQYISQPQRADNGLDPAHSKQTREKSASPSVAVIERSDTDSRPASSGSSSTSFSILNRKRPVAPAGAQMKRKPTPSETTVISVSAGASMKENTRETTRETTKDKSNKTLPKLPVHAAREDIVQALQDKQDILRRRRRNLETVIGELTNVAQPSSITYDRASRAEIKKTVAGLEKEMAEVLRDEHETGLKLHRTLKRQDGGLSYEPTSIWVRRVTS